MKAKTIKDYKKELRTLKSQHTTVCKSYNDICNKIEKFREANQKFLEVSESYSAENKQLRSDLAKQSELYLTERAKALTYTKEIGRLNAQIDELKNNQTDMISVSNAGLWVGASFIISMLITWFAR